MLTNVVWFAAVFCAISRAPAEGAATLLGVTGSGEGSHTTAGGFGLAEGSTVAVDVTDQSMTRIHGDALKLDVQLVELLTAGGVLRLTPSHWEFVLGATQGGKWAGTVTDSMTTLYLNDKVVMQLAVTSGVAESTVVMTLPRGKLVARDVTLDAALGAQTRVDLCRARAVLAQAAGQTMPSEASCDAHRDSSQLSVQQCLDALSSILLATARHAVVSGGSQEVGVVAGQEVAPSGLDLGQIKEIIRTTFSQELQPSLTRDSAQRIDSAKDELRRELTALVEQQVSQALAATKQLEGTVQGHSVALESLKSASVGLPGGTASADAYRIDEKAEKNSVGIAVLQSQLDKSEVARGVLEETVATLRERISKLEALIEYALKK